MKTAVSIADDIYRRAERLARRTKRTRSRLFSDALDEYLARHEGDEVTSALNTALEQVGGDETKDARFLTAAASRVLKRTKW